MFFNLVIGNHVPLDTFITNLCECSYVHPLLERFKVKWKFTTPFIRLAFLLATGSSVGYNQWAGGKPSHLIRRGYHIINKSTDAMPFLNRPHKSKTWLGRNLYSRIDNTPMAQSFPNRSADVAPGAVEYDCNGKVTFEDGSSDVFDVIVFATGYKLCFPFMKSCGSKVAEVSTTEPVGFPQDALPTLHNILNPENPSLAFIGFVRPNVGAIPPMSELQVYYWLSFMEGNILSSGQGLFGNGNTYQLYGQNQRTSAYAVDYGAYMHGLAREMGAEPSIGDLVVRSPKSLFAWAMGQAYVTFFRLQGPFRWDGALDVSENELFRPVLARPLISNILFFSIICLFMGLNAFAFILSPFLRCNKSNAKC